MEQPHEQPTSTRFVERHFETPAGPVVASFEAPYRAPGGEYRCRWRVTWPDRERGFTAAGGDGIQALMLAMRIAHAELVTCDEYQAGQLTYLDQTDLDLPPTWGTGRLYDERLPPPDREDG